jgi:hypothetical protein
MNIPWKTIFCYLDMSDSQCVGRASRMKLEPKTCNRTPPLPYLPGRRRGTRREKPAIYRVESWPMRGRA